MRRIQVGSFRQVINCINDWGKATPRKAHAVHRIAGVAFSRVVGDLQFYWLLLGLGANTQNRNAGGTLMSS